jgi:gamma-glutamyltranspeptidase / glutathione hydrolase
VQGGTSIKKWRSVAGRTVGGLLVAFALDLFRASGISWATPTDGESVAALANVMSLTSHARVRVQASEDAVVDERLLDPGFLAAYRKDIAAHPWARSGTTPISAIDRTGNAAAATLSNGEGSACVVPGCGIVLNNMLGEEDLHSTGFNRWAVDRRMTSMMAPTLVRLDDGGAIATGSGGSNRIRSAIVQVLLNILDAGLPVDEAIEAPRIHLEGERLSVEAGIDRERISNTLAHYPDHELWDEPNMFFGGAHTVVAKAKGVTHGAGDARRGWIRRNEDIYGFTRTA